MTGLVGWWPLNENSGSTARDLSGNSNNGTLNSGVKQGVAGKAGLTAYSFNDSDGGVTIDDSKELEFSSNSDFSISAWFRTDSITDSNAHSIICKRDRNDAENFGYEAYLTSSELTFQIKSKSGSNSSITTSQEYDDSNWHHVACVREASKGIRLYIDGNLAGSSGDVGDLRTGRSLFIGRTDGGLNSSYKFYWPGDISDVRIYDRYLTPQEVRTLYAWGSGDYTNPQYHDGTDNGAVSRWKFEGDATDSWGVSDGTVEGATYTSDGGIRNGAYSFDGSDQYVEVPIKSQSNPMTVSFWAYPQTSDKATIISNFDSTGDDWNIDYGNTDNTFRSWGDSGDWIVTSASYPTGSWHHVVLKVKDNGDAQFIVNSTRDGQGANHQGMLDNGTNYQIGNRPYDDRFGFKGLIDDLRIYNRALEPHEVFQLYQWGTKGRDMRKMTVNARGDE